MKEQRRGKRKKRGQNEGTIFEERPGRWIAQITLGYEVVDGKRIRKRKKFTAATREVVRKKLTAALNEQQTGGVVPLQKDALGPCLEAWVPSLRHKDRSEKTIESYAWMVKNHIAPEIGHIALTKLTQLMLNEFMDRKVKAGCSVRTVRYCHAIVRSALSKAEKDGLVARNVAKLAEPPGQAIKHRIEPLSPDEAARILAYVAGHRLEALYSVALAIGLRRGEVMGLEWTAVDLDRGLLKVTQTVQRIARKGLVLFKKGKTDKSLRTIPLPTFAIAALHRHRELQSEERQLAGENWKEHGLVFTSSVGTPIEPSNLLRHYHQVLKTLKIDQRRFHDLRHRA